MAFPMEYSHSKRMDVGEYEVTVTESVGGERSIYCIY